eukprot:135280-Rhodomonas_salina.3
MLWGGQATCMDMFSTECKEDSYWSTVQSCVPKQCLAHNGHLSWAVPFNTSYTIPCPAGHVPTNADPEPQCQVCAVLPASASPCRGL